MVEAPVSSKNDSPPQFELNVSFPPDTRFVVTARELAVHAARHAGCTEARARAFGDEVEATILSCMERGNTDAPLPMVVRRTTGPVEVLVNGRTIALEP
jgi:hypothetical protein